MTTLQAAIPDDLHEAVLAQAEREHISVDALISRTLRAAVALPLLGLSVQERAARGNWEDFDRIMPASRTRRQCRATSGSVPSGARAVDRRRTSADWRRR